MTRAASHNGYRVRRHPALTAAGICLGLLFGGTASALDGRVIDAVTGAPIAAATVTVGDRAQASDSSGLFRIDGADMPVMARAPGYRAGGVSGTELAKTGVVRLTPFEAKAVYLTVYGIGYRPLREAAIALTRTSDVNALVIDIKGDRGVIDYPSAVPMAASSGARSMTSIPDLGALAKSLHDQGIYAIARIVVFKDNPLATARPDLAIKRANGELFRDREKLAWTDPFQPEVWNYNIAIAVEAARAGFDEIQFDYLRFPDSVERLRLAKEPTRATRVEAIAGFLAEAKRQLAPYNVFLAADFFGYVCWNLDDTGIGQQLAELSKSADYLSPMLYPSGFQFGIPGYTNPVTHPYEIVHQSLERARTRLGVSPKRFRPWLQAFKDYAFDRRTFDADEVMAQIRAAKDFGSDGWMLWNARNDYSGIGVASSGDDRPLEEPQRAASYDVSSSCS
jgi:hypothetical protein